MEANQILLPNKKKKSFHDHIFKTKRKKINHQSLSRLEKVNTNISVLNSQQNQPGKSALQALRQLGDNFDDRMQVWQQSVPFCDDYKSLSLINSSPFKSETKIGKYNRNQLQSPTKLKTQPNCLSTISKKFSSIQRNPKIKNINNRGCLTVKNVQICQLCPKRQSNQKLLKVKRSFNISIKRNIKDRQLISTHDSCRNRKSVELKTFQFDTLTKNNSFTVRKPQQQIKYIANKKKALENAKIKLKMNLLHNSQAETLIQFIRKANQQSMHKIAQLNRQRQKKDPIFIFKYQH